VTEKATEAPAKAVEGKQDTDAVKGYQKRIRIDREAAVRREAREDILAQAVQAQHERDKQAGVSVEGEDDKVGKLLDGYSKARMTDAYWEIEQLAKTSGWDVNDPRLEAAHALGKAGFFSQAVQVARSTIQPSGDDAGQKPVAHTTQASADQPANTYSEAEVAAEVERRVKEATLKRFPRDMGPSTAPESDTSHLSPFDKIAAGLRKKAKSD